MTFKGRLTYEERRHRRKQWNRWFAWHPVHLDTTPEGRKVIVWLTWLERKGTPPNYSMDSWTYEYRRVGQTMKQGVAYCDHDCNHLRG